MPEESYYVKSGEREKGPYPIATLRASLFEGSLKPTTLVCAKGTTDWVRLDTIVKPDAAARRSAAASSSAIEAEVNARAADEGKQRDVLLGGLICAVGLIVTIVSYSSASEGGGGRYLVAWGAILFGGIRLIRGLSK